MKAIIGLVSIVAAMTTAVLGGAGLVANAETVSFTVEAAGANEVPAVTSAGSASAQFVFDSETNELTYVIAVRGISEDEVTAAHIHNGPAGENGPVIYALAEEGFLQTNGSIELTDEDVDALMAGELYVNVHSEEYPDGFARAQIPPPELAESADGEASPTPATTSTVTPESATQLQPPSTGDAGLLNQDGTDLFIPVVILLTMLGAGSGILLMRHRA
jgi:hypothetical protein